MREVKFRIWDVRQKYFIDSWWIQFGNGTIRIITDVGCYYDIKNCHADDKNQYIVQQYTGCKDKNGKEIYEGDLIIYDSSVKEVIWYEGDSAWRLKEKSGNISMSFNGWVKHSSVIGNIFENAQ